jgi:hypothetical protein
MTAGQIAELKDFLLAVLGDTEARLNYRFEEIETKMALRFEEIGYRSQKIEEQIGELNHQMSAGFEGVADTVVDLYNTIDKRVAALEHRD